MASVEECEKALQELAGKLAGSSGTDLRNKIEDRSVSCELRDLKMIFLGHLRDGGLRDIRQVDNPKAQIRLAMSSDDLIALTRGDLHLASAWATGRVKVHASVLDLLKLRSLI
ncbi:MAG TPA: SCP2 sterol-binding domain-containing protein [Mycobacteriales bacterium]|nr:SCP2 sterol-binding domain-containing protein [Mycobacteriales bacterium]